MICKSSPLDQNKSYDSIRIFFDFLSLLRDIYIIHSSWCQIDQVLHSEFPFNPEHIVPVCMDSIHHDGTTLPPIVTQKRSAGRPKSTRIRKRSRYTCEPERSNITCSRCNNKPGHNVRTFWRGKH
jgi:hypothetical protein